MVLELSKDNPQLENMEPKIKDNGTKVHMDALKEYGSTNGHRMAFKPCQD